MAIRCKPAQWQRVYLSELNDFITTDECALLLRMSETYVRRACCEGKLPAVKWGKKWLISKAKLLERYDMN